MNNTYLVTTIANALAKTLTNEEIIILAALFVQLGDTLATLSLITEKPFG